MSGPVPKHLRNPRRAYNRDGTEVRPATVRSVRALGVNTASIYCNGCRRQVIVSLDGMPDDQPIPDIPITYRLKCSACGSKSVGAMLNVVAHYDHDRVVRGQESRLPADRGILRIDRS